MKTIPVRHISENLEEPTISGNFTIRDMETLLDGKSMVQELHRHDFYFLLVLKTGSGIHEIDFTSYQVADRSIFFMRPGQVHQHSLNAGSSGFLVQFKSDFYHPHDKTSARIFRRASSNNHYQLKAKAFERLQSILHSIYRESHEKQEGYQEVIKANLGIFFVELVRQLDQKVSTQAKAYEQHRLEEFLELLEHHIFENKQVAYYSNLMNLSSYQLNAITKATMGKTPSELINEYIMLEAKRNLLATSNQVNQIGLHMGFEDVSYFIRFFKKHSGLSPEAFRKKFA